MKTIKHEIKHRQPDTYYELYESYSEKLQEDDTLTTFFEKIERTLDPVCDAIRKAMRRLEINI